MLQIELLGGKDAKMSHDIINYTLAREILSCNTSTLSCDNIIS